MKAKQEAKLTMYRAVERHCDENTSIISTVPAFQTAYNNFKAKIADILNTAQKKDVGLKGIAADKDSRKQALCQIASDVASIIYAYASATSNNTLKEEVNFSLSALQKTRDDQLAPRCQNIHDKGLANIGALKDYGITNANLATLQTPIDNYSAETPKPRTALSQRKILVSNLAQLFKDADAILKDQLDRLAINFKTDNPDFVTQYESNRIIVDTARTTTQLKGTVTNSTDDKPVKGASVTVVETSKTATTNSKGNYTIKPLPNGTYTIRVTTEGFKDFEVDGVEIKFGAINELSMKLASN